MQVDILLLYLLVKVFDLFLKWEISLLKFSYNERRQYKHNLPSPIYHTTSEDCTTPRGRYNLQASVVHKLDNAIHWVKLYLDQWILPETHNPLWVSDITQLILILNNLTVIYLVDSIILCLNNCPVPDVPVSAEGSVSDKTPLKTHLLVLQTCSCN